MGPDSSFERIFPMWLGPLLVIGAIAALGFAYVGLCVWFASLADQCEVRERPRAVEAAPDEKPRMPFNWLVPAALAVVLGFTPCAIAALVHASRVAPHYRAGCFEAARWYALQARNWFWWSFAIGLTLIALCTALPWILAVSSAVG